MRSLRYGWTVAAFGLLYISGPPLAGQTIMTGTVRDDSTGRPLAGVEVLIERSNRQTTTDNTGRYLLTEVPTGARVALFRFVGYRPVRLRLQIAKGDTVRADASLLKEGAQRLEPVEVTEAAKAPRGIGREAFEERRRLGFGKFIDSTELRRFEGRRLSDVLRGRAGIRLVTFQEPLPGSPGGGPGRGPTEMRAASPRGNDFDGRQCWMTVLFDEIPIYREGSAGRPPDLSRDFSIASLESIEIYTNPAETPVEFGGGSAGCGVLVLWSRRK